MGRHAHAHVPIPRQLDLRAQAPLVHHNATVASTLIHVPGFLAGAAFFTALRFNLVLPVAALHSNTSTPLLYPSTSQLPPLFPTIYTMSTLEEPQSPPPAADPLSDVPDLTTHVLTTSEDKTAALKLIADSIAQQRQLASSALIYHPATLALYVLLLALTTQLMYKSRSDLGLLITTFAGVSMALLVAIRGLTSGYLALAEAISFAFLRAPTGEDDILIGSHFGPHLIGATALRLCSSRPSSPSSRKRAKQGKTGGKGIVRAWTVKMRYRGTGVGTEMLEEAVRVTRERLGKDAEVGFAREHANSGRVLWEMFNGVFKRSEARAARALEGVLGKRKR